MAIVRCEQCGLKISRTKRDYVKMVKPRGYPDTAVICGLLKCENPGVVCRWRNMSSKSTRKVQEFLGFRVLQRR